ncbi:hypothetical protein CNYM01_13807 [Colletotrichum nymphaeae SA-01]|uniref:Uncharacterized protein n=1 Tax=Colletotrichum nymphaeae SA-01 TaxID=1460502 RepID=A0A135UD80_9PEZI|nr:hypothetical protein CNYM01_13807 [Colletotrichum nymphaeae SA-01]
MDIIDHLHLDAGQLLLRGPGPLLGQKMLLGSVGPVADRAKTRRESEAGLYGTGGSQATCEDMDACVCQMQSMAPGVEFAFDFDVWVVIIPGGTMQGPCRLLLPIEARKGPGPVRFLPSSRQSGERSPLSVTFGMLMCIPEYGSHGSTIEDGHNTGQQRPNLKRLRYDAQNTRSFSLGQRIADALGDNGDGEITTSYLARSEICIAEHSRWK